MYIVHFNRFDTNAEYLFFKLHTDIEIEMKISGTAGHGSLLLQSTAGEKLNRILSEYIQFRNKEYRKLTGNPKLSIGDVTTANLTVINGGLQRNVVPPLITIVMDIRLAIDMPFEEMDREVIINCLMMMSLYVFVIIKRGLFLRLKTGSRLVAKE